MTVDDVLRKCKCYAKTVWLHTSEEGFGNDPLGDEVEYEAADCTYISTELRNDPGLHFPLIDLDLPAFLVPSSTPGHSHLVIEKEVGYKQYMKILDALVKAGIVQKGYRDGAKIRKHGGIRKPGVKK